MKENEYQILVVDDSRVYRRYQSMSIAEHINADIVEAEDGLIATEILKEKEFDLVVTDRMMPNMDGIQLCNFIKNGNGKNIPLVIMVTSKDSLNDTVAGLDAGVDDYLSKEADSKELVARVKAILRIRDLQESLEARNTELKVAYNDLKRMQGEMVHSMKIASVARLVAGLLHEINNPLAFIRNGTDAMIIWAEDFLDLLSKEGVIELNSQSEILGDFNEMQNVVKEGCSRISGILQDLRQFSGYQQEPLKLIDINNCVERAVKLLKYYIGEKITIERDLKDLPTITSDGAGLGEVFHHLLINAIEIMKGEGTINISGYVKDQYVFLEILDTGPGIEDSIREKVFDPFFTTKDVGEGKGLGLSICFGILSKLGGEIMLDDCDIGTKFKIKLYKEPPKDILKTYYPGEYHDENKE